jgi:C-terminal processing protease CtpA/Prc
VWYDDLELSVEDSQGRWQPIAIQDPGFESRNLFSSWAGGTDAASSNPLRGWTVQLDDVNPASGHWALRVEPATSVLTKELFDEAPAPGETVDLDLGQGLHARVPLTLDSQDGHTIGDDPAAARALQAGPSAAPSNGFDRLCGVADVIVVWNVLEHFWPYWDVVRTDWNAALDAALADALNDQNLDDHVATLERLSAAAPDGHAETICPGARPRGYLPFLIDSIENQLIVTSSTTTAVAPGDIIVAIDGRPAGDLLAAEVALQSGSPQYRVVAATGEVGASSVGSTARVRVRRGGAERDVALPRGRKVTPQFTRSPIERLDDGVYYVDLGRATMTALMEILDRLAAAPGVVFDLRDYPNNNDKILSYLLTAPAVFTEEMSVPRVIRPDHAIASWKTFHGEVPVLTPHIAGRVAFLTGPRAISYAESVMSIVEHYHLAEIVGAPTAGTNGNIAEITTPLGCRTLFTAMRVVKRDGRQHHLVGIQPTLPASRTIAGVIAGRDEVLEKALRYVRTGTR